MSSAVGVCCCGDDHNKKHSKAFGVLGHRSSTFYTLCTGRMCVCAVCVYRIARFISSHAYTAMNIIVIHVWLHVT